MDVIEIDAASNTQVDKTRDVIIDNAQYRPAHSRFKIYIIDEVHMLSKGSFNALLKTLEEPPEHVKFILATTEAEKVLQTIQSRCQRYDFRNIPAREIVEHLKRVCKEEKIKADEDALMLVAKSGAGSMRDSLSLLDRLLSIGEKHLTIESIEQMLGLPRSQAVFDLAQFIGEGKTKDVLTTTDRLINEGLSPDSLLVSLVDHFRNLLILKTCGPDAGLVDVAGMSVKEMARQADQFDASVLTQDITLLEDLRRQLRQTQAGRAILDATLVRLSLSEQFASIGDLLNRVNGPATKPVQKKKLEVDEGSGFGVQGSAEIPPTNVESASADAATPQPAMAPVAPSPTSDDDDDLPRPGKVWDNSGPSLSELLKQQQQKAQQPAPATTAPTHTNSASNVEAVDESDLPAVWQALLSVLRDRVGVHPLVAGGEFMGIHDGQAVIRYSADKDQFPKMLSRGGKKELVGEALSQVLGRAVGVRFEVAGEAPSALPSNGNDNGHGNGHAAAAPPPPPRVSVSVARRAPSPEPEPAPATPAAGSSQSTAGRPTPEQVAELEKHPLVGALMRELGATIVKIAEET
jgi:DNA polymerase-3 subunit gamma/tau